MVRRIFCGSLIFGRLANVRRAPKRFDRKREPRCACGRWRRAGCRRRRRPYVTSGRSRRSRPGVRHRRGRGRSGPRWPRIARKRMISAPNAAFRVDRSPSLCSAGRFDIIQLLHGDLHRLRRPQGARRSPEALVSEKRRMVSAACCERVRASVEVCATCPSIDGPDRRRERLDRGRERLGAPPGAQNSSFLLDS